MGEGEEVMGSGMEKEQVIAGTGPDAAIAEASEEEFFDLMWQVYSYCKSHPEAWKYVGNSYKRRRREYTRTARGGDEFWLALWQLMLMGLKDLLRRGADDCKEGGEAKPLLLAILDVLESTLAGKDIQTWMSLDLMDFLDAVEPLAEKARDAMYPELNDDEGYAALDLLEALESLLLNDQFFTIPIDPRDHI